MVPNPNYLVGFSRSHCHYSFGCNKYLERCGNCPHLGSKSENDLSTLVQQRKKNILVLWFCSPTISNKYVYDIWNSILWVVTYSRLSSAIYDTAVVVEKICKIKLYNDIIEYANYE